jgi:hypothetical protein
MYGVLPASPHVLRSDYEASMLVVYAGMRDYMEDVAVGRGDNENTSSHPTP